MSNQELIKKRMEMQHALQDELTNKVFMLRGQQVVLDTDVAKLYGVETRIVNQAVKRNIDKFPDGYMFRVEKEEFMQLRSQNVIANISPMNRNLPVVFTEKGLYMLATVLKSPNATVATFAIIETFASVRSLQRELLELHQEKDTSVQQTKMEHFGQVLSEIVMPELETTETESTLELNFFIGKLKHTVKRVKRNDNLND